MLCFLEPDSSSKNRQTAFTFEDVYSNTFGLWSVIVVIANSFETVVKQRIVNTISKCCLCALFLTEPCKTLVFLLLGLIHRMSNNRTSMIVNYIAFLNSQRLH